MGRPAQERAATAAVIRFLFFLIKTNRLIMEKLGVEAVAFDHSTAAELSDLSIEFLEEHGGMEMHD